MQEEVFMHKRIYFKIFLKVKLLTNRESLVGYYF